MGEKLIGTSTVGDTQRGNTAIFYCRFQCVASGNCDTIKVYPLVNGNVRVAIYTDNAGAPQTLLVESNSTAVTTGDWRSVSISPTALISGTYYWLADQVQVNGANSYRALAGAQGSYQYYSYGAFPATATPLELDGFEAALQGWSTTGTTYDETGKVQTILVAMGKNDASIINELGKLQVVLTAQGENNLATLNEIGKEQIILAIIESWAGIIYQEIELEQIILTIQGKTESATFNETGKLQVILAEIVGWVGNLYDEIGRLQVVLVTQGSTDSAIINELSKIQTILSIWGKSTQATFNETGRLQVILAKIGEIELITARLVKLLLEIQSKTNMNLHLDSKVKMDLEVGSKSLMQLELMGGGE